MKRLRVILLFLLLGAIVNVAVAWGLALTLTIKNTSNDVAFGMSRAVDENWILERRRTFGTHYYISRHTKVHQDDKELSALKELYGRDTIQDVKPGWGSMDVTTDLYQTLPGLPKPPMENRMFEARGWPMLSLWCRRKLIVRDDTDIKRFGPRGLIAIPILDDDEGGPRGLPRYPIWSGLLLNTFFYAAILWLLIPGPFVLRRLIRRKRGLCVKCAYDLRGMDHEACPECGAETPS